MIKQALKMPERFLWNEVKTNPMAPLISQTMVQSFTLQRQEIIKKYKIASYCETAICKQLAKWNRIYFFLLFALFTHFGLLFYLSIFVEICKCHMQLKKINTFNAAVSTEWVLFKSMFCAVLPLLDSSSLNNMWERWKHRLDPNLGRCNKDTFKEMWKIYVNLKN